MSHCGEVNLIAQRTTSPDELGMSITAVHAPMPDDGSLGSRNFGSETLGIVR